MCNGTPFTVEKISPRVRIELGPQDQYGAPGALGSNWLFTFAQVFQWCCWRPWDLRVSQRVKNVKSSSMLHQGAAVAQWLKRLPTDLAK